MIISHVILSIGWLIYGGLHSIFAVPRVKTFICTRMGWNLLQYRRAYNIFAVLALVAMVSATFIIESTILFKVNIFTIIAAILFFAGGLLIMIKCANLYGGELIGVTDKEATLKTNGLHSFMRHPLYTGTFALLIGIFLFVPRLSFGLTVAAIIIYTMVAISWEEAKLIKIYGDSYREYRKKTSAIIPYLI